MADSGDHHRGLFHHHKKPEDEVLVTETTDIYASETASDGRHDSKVEIKQHARKEHIGEAAALVGGAFTLYEKHQAKKDPENAHKHHIAEAIGGAVTVGSGAYALHERHDKKDVEKEAKHHHH